MPRKYIKKKTEERYSRDDLPRAVSDVKNPRKKQRKPDIIYNFYEQLGNIVSEKKTDNPAFVFNADESAFGNDPSRVKAIGERGKPFPRVSGGSERESTSILEVQARWTSTKTYPATVCSASSNGWMEEPQFFNWFNSVFVKWVKELRVTKNLPEQEALLLYVGHKTPKTDRLQPLDKGSFGLVKNSWGKKTDCSWKKKHIGHKVGRLKKNEFTALLGEIWKESITQNNFKNSFLTTAVFPVNSPKFPEEEFNPIELKSNSVTPAIDIIAIFSSAITTTTMTTALNTISVEPKKVTLRLKQAQYGEVLTTVEVPNRLREAKT
ncbi:hypothetical protein ILUMI_14758 [Ignelater luminosus]|uniref:DDE-1 domain-containing protein n=1 Tax=Ignelater luminosus TaxID=2038154 RepID=A0A8K0CXZ7_IGNLU|nr:hypothetical protein ILUMI_14758 [Ignelater luminosus]